MKACHRVTGRLYLVTNAPLNNRRLPHTPKQNKNYVRVVQDGARALHMKTVFRFLAISPNNSLSFLLRQGLTKSLQMAFPLLASRVAGVIGALLIFFILVYS